MRVTVSLPGVLRQHAGGRGQLPVEVPEAATLAVLFDRLAADLPALERRMRDETGALRRHVNIFVDAADARDTGGFATVLNADAEVMVVPAVSGG